MKITRVEAVQVVGMPVSAAQPSWHDIAPRPFPLNRCEGFPPGPPHQTPGIQGVPVWAKVTTEDGTWGLGRCSFGTPVAALIDGHYGPLLAGRDCMAIEYLHDIMIKSTARIGIEGLSAIARSGIDLALWDLKGKLLGKPVYSLLGGPSRSSIACYCTTEDLEWAKDLGFTAFKISNPATVEDGEKGISLLDDRVGQARSLVGDDAELMVNATMSFDAEYTVRILSRLEQYRLAWFEEPLPPWDLNGYSDIRGRCPQIPIAAGEDLHSRYAYHELLNRRCVDVVQPDIEWCGGLTEMLKIAVLADAAGVSVSPHMGCNTPYGQHFCYAITNIRNGEFYLRTPPGTPLDESPRIPGTAVPEAGEVTPSDAPGFGIEILADALAPWDYNDIRNCL